MQVIVTAVGPDNRGLADPIVHYVTGAGANIHEIQMYDHDSEHLFAMLMRMEWPVREHSIASLRNVLNEIGQRTELEVRTWSRHEHDRPPRLAICTTYRPESARAVLRAIEEGRLNAEASVMIGSRETCRDVAEEFGVEWVCIGDAKGNPDNDRLEQIVHDSDIDFIVLARYMRILPPGTVWRFAGGRIINLHHGLLPSFPGLRPYHDAWKANMVTFGSTIHFIVPELDAGNQIIHQSTFEVFPGTSLDEIERIGERDHEPRCLVEGLRRVVDHKVELHFHRVVRA